MSTLEQLMKVKALALAMKVPKKNGMTSKDASYGDPDPNIVLDEDVNELPFDDLYDRKLERTPESIPQMNPDRKIRRRA